MTSPKVDKPGDVDFSEAADRQPEKEFSSNSVHLVIQSLVPTQPKHHYMSFERDGIMQTDQQISNAPLWEVALN